MEIQFKNQPTTEFRHLKIGDCFRTSRNSDEYLIKTSLEFKPNAIRFADGRWDAVVLFDGIKTYKVNATLVIND